MIAWLFQMLADYGSGDYGERKSVAPSGPQLVEPASGFVESEQPKVRPGAEEQADPVRRREGSRGTSIGGADVHGDTHAWR